MTSKRLTGAEIIWESLVCSGVTHVFGYPGGTILPAYDAIWKYPQIHHTLVRHEQGAAHMADGYARASGKVGVAVATSGPGATNLVTGIATAMMDSSPIVCITGQVPAWAVVTDYFQEIDITGVTLPITKHNVMVTRAEDIGRAIREAFLIARSGRPGPVLVDITKDAQAASADFNWDECTPQLPGYRPPMRLDMKELERAVELLNKAERPVILAGHGIIMSGASRQVQELAERAQIPMALTLLGLGCVPAFHPLNLGMMGMHGEAWVNHAIHGADLLLALGMRFDDRVIGDAANYAPNAKKIHVEVDRAEVNKIIKVDVALISDLRKVVDAMLPRVEKREHTEWLTYINELKGDAAVRDIRNLPDMGKLYAAHVIHDLWKETDGKAVVVSDVGQHQMWEAQYYHHSEPRSLITSGGLGTMGFSLPAAIGAKFARPESEVWVVVGDGGFQMTSCELATLAQEELDVKIAVINNGYLGMVRQWQEFFYNGRYNATPLKSPDFVKLAEAHGIRGIMADKRPDVVTAVRAARAHKGPCLINFKVEKEDSVYPMVPAGARLDQMIRRPRQEAAETAEQEK